MQLSRETCLEYENLNLKMSLYKERRAHMDSILLTYEEKLTEFYKVIETKLKDNGIDIKNVQIDFKTGLVTLLNEPVPTDTPPPTK